MVFFLFLLKSDDTWGVLRCKFHKIKESKRERLFLSSSFKFIFRVLFKKGLKRSVFFPSFFKFLVVPKRSSSSSSSSSQKKSERKKNHVRRCSLLRESRRPDDANEFRADETRERETGESVEKSNRREGNVLSLLMSVLLVFSFVFFLSFWFCVSFCGRMMMKIRRRRPNGESRQVAREKRPPIDDARKKTKIASRALSRARCRGTQSRASVATRVVFPFSRAVWW